jgi:hypothetical protein
MNELSQYFKWTRDEYDARLSQFELRIYSKYLDYYNEIKDRLAELHGKAKNINEAFRYGRLENMEKQIAGILNRMNSEINGGTEKLIKETFAKSYYGAGWGYESATGMDLRFGLLNEKTIEASMINPYDRIKWQERMDLGAHNLNKGIRQKVFDGLIRGDGYRKTAIEVKDTMGKYFSNNILRIVRTESQRAHNWGNLTSYNQAKEYGEEAGLKMTRVWLSTLDSRTRQDHIDMDGREEEKTKEGGWILPDGTWTEAPTMSGVASQDINCRCTTVTNIEGMKPSLMRVRGEGVKKYETYNQYFQNRVLKVKAPIKNPAPLKALTVPSNVIKEKIIKEKVKKPKVVKEKVKKERVKKEKKEKIKPMKRDRKISPVESNRKRLESANYTTTEDLGGGVNGSFIKTAPDGTKGVFKPKSMEYGGFANLEQWKNEISASIIDEELGMNLVPTTVKYTDARAGVGSLQEFKHGYKTLNTAGTRDIERVRDIIIDTDLGERISLMDAILANTDRHGGNLMINSTGEVALIDNGIIFRGQTYFNDLVEEAGNHWGWKMNDGIKEKLKKFLSNRTRVEARLKEVELAQHKIDDMFARAKYLSEHDWEQPSFYQHKDWWE